MLVKHIIDSEALTIQNTSIADVAELVEAPDFELGLLVGSNPTIRANQLKA